MSSTWQGERNPGRLRRKAKWQSLEQEFGEPLPDIITGLREQGNSWRTVAGALGVNLSTLQQWRHALHLPLDPNNKIYDPSSLPAQTRSDSKAQALGYCDAPSAITDMRLNQRLTLKEIGARLGIHWQHVSTLSPHNARVYNLSRRGREAHRQQVATRKRGGPDHPWSKDNEHVFASKAPGANAASHTAAGATHDKANSLIARQDAALSA